MDLTLILLAALSIGLCLGLFGSGGSILTVPILIYLVQLPEKLAIGSALGIVSVISLVALLPYLYRKQLQWPLIVQLAVPGIVGAVLGGWLSQFFSAALQIVLLALLMLLCALNMWRRQLWRMPLRRGWPLWLAGTGLGAVTGLIGVGGGFLIVPLLLAITSLSMAEAIATSLFLVWLQSSSGFVSHYYVLLAEGIQIDFLLIAAIGGIGALGSLLALWLGQRLDQAKLRRGFAIFLVLLAVFMLGQQL